MPTSRPQVTAAVVVDYGDGLVTRITVVRPLPGQIFGSLEPPAVDVPEDIRQALADWLAR